MEKNLRREYDENERDLCQNGTEFRRGRFRITWKNEYNIYFISMNFRS